MIAALSNLLPVLSARLPSDNPLAFLNCQDLVGGDAGEVFTLGVLPADRDVCRISLPDSEVQAGSFCDMNEPPLRTSSMC